MRHLQRRPPPLCMAPCVGSYLCGCPECHGNALALVVIGVVLAVGVALGVAARWVWRVT